MRSILNKSFLYLFCSLVMAALNASAQISAASSELQLGEIALVDGVSNQFCLIQGATTGVCYMSAHKAAEYCAAVGGQLPTEPQLKLLGGVNPNSSTDELYWTSSQTSASAGLPVAVNGTTGFTIGVDANEPLAVRCLEAK